MENCASSLELPLVWSMLHKTPTSRNSLFRNIQRDPMFGLATLKSARPFLGLPGIGHAFWNSSTAHMMNDIPSIVSNFRIPDLTEWSSPDNCINHNAILDRLKTWSTAFKPLDQGSLYEPCWDRAEIGRVKEAMAIRIPIKTNFPQNWYQDGSCIKEPKKYFHGTRSSLVPEICWAGLNPSLLSHGKIGLWINTCLPEALQWNMTFFDQFPSLALELAVESECICSNRRVRAGSLTRAVATINQFRIIAIIAMIPSLALNEFQLEMGATVRKTIASLHPTAPPEFVTSICVKTFQLAGYRYSYRSIPGAFSTRFAGISNEVLPLVSCLSIILASILSAFSLQNPVKKGQRISMHFWDDIPTVFQQWLLNRFPNIDGCMMPGNSDDPPDWNISRAWKLEPWSFQPDDPIFTIHPIELVSQNNL